MIKFVSTHGTFDSANKEFSHSGSFLQCKPNLPCQALSIICNTATLVDRVCLGYVTIFFWIWVMYRKALLLMVIKYKSLFFHSSSMSHLEKLQAWRIILTVTERLAFMNKPWLEYCYLQMWRLQRWREHWACEGHKEDKVIARWECKKYSKRGHKSFLQGGGIWAKTSMISRHHSESLGLGRFLFVCSDS